MKLKFTYQRPAGSVDLVATVDAATTVGQLAAHLHLADASRRGAPVDPNVTMSFVDDRSRPLDPRQPVSDSALRSGCSVTVHAAGTSHAVGGDRPAAALVEVLSGTDAGKSFQVPVGAAVIGRERGCEIRLADELVSRRHARLNVGDTLEIVDLGSANGVLIDDVPVPRSILRATDVVQIGDTRLAVKLLHPTGGSAGSSHADAFVRPPRVHPQFNGRSFEAPEPPERATGQRFPLVSLLAPLLMGAVLYFVTKNAASLIFIALSPLMLIGNSVEGRLSRRSEYKRARREFDEDVDSLLADLDASAVEEVAARLADHPAVEECAEAARQGTDLLWSRRPDEPGFGEVRLGLGRQPSLTTVELPRLKRSVRELHAQLAATTQERAWVDPVPVLGRLASSAVGIAGPRVLVADAARAVVAQVACLHSPAELSIGLVASTHTVADWEWLTWLPHPSSPQGPIDSRLLTASAGVAGGLVAEVEDLIARRVDDTETVAGPALLLVVEADAPVEHARLVAIAEHGPAVGVFVLWLADEVVALPAACTTFLELGRDTVTGSVGEVHEGTTVSPVRAEQLSREHAAELARALAPLTDAGARALDDSDLPQAVGLVSITGTDLATSADTVVERWRESRSIVRGRFAPPVPARHAGTLRAVIGQTGADSHALDLRADGPHALVGGTTGAGKSELLQTWILAMAAAHSPQRLTFLLVDYKGGSAFSDCVDLPHTVGLVTDLTPHLVRRALRSLTAELRYRERLLATHRAKDLVTLEKEGVTDAPPSLVLVVDEFAALVAEVPDFVDGVVNVAQRGRSLGLHLILATQRPAGVIKDNLRANTNLRLALRMADEADSTDVLGSPTAAFFDPAVPGRAVSKTGPGRLVPFQTGYVGGWTSDVPPAPEILVEELSVASPLAWVVPDSARPVVEDPGPTDIRRIVDRIKEASATAEIEPPRKPWLPELDTVYDLVDEERVPSELLDTRLVFGVRDSPDTQSQPTVAFHPDRDGSLAVYGTGGSGKSTLLRAIATAAGLSVHGGPCQVYGIDFGARGLAMLADLPHVGSVVGGADHERITRLLGRLRRTIDERALRYSRVNAGTITDYRSLTGDQAEPRLILLVDGITAFRSAYEPPDRLRWFDVFTSIVADGRPVGVHVVMSSDQRGGLSTALASAVQARVVLRMANVDDYGMLGVESDIIAPGAEPGRGVMGTDEIQVAVLGGTSDPVQQAAAVAELAGALRRSGVPEAPEIRSLPEVVTYDELPATVDGLPVIGTASGSLGPATFEPNGGFIISGPPASGRTTALRTVAAAIRRAEPGLSLHFFGSARSPLATLGLWDGVATLASAEGAVETLTDELAAGGRVALFVENIGQFLGSPVDFALGNLVRKVLDEEGLVVVEGETSTLSGSGAVLAAVKATRSGLALAPDPSDGQIVYRTAFPRSAPAERIPGRGYLVRSGQIEVVQVAIPERR